LSRTTCGSAVLTPPGDEDVSLGDPARVLAKRGDPRLVAAEAADEQLRLAPATGLLERPQGALGRVVVHGIEDDVVVLRDARQEVLNRLETGLQSRLPVELDGVGTHLGRRGRDGGGRHILKPQKWGDGRVEVAHAVIHLFPGGGVLADEHGGVRGVPAALLADLTNRLGRPLAQCPVVDVEELAGRRGEVD